MNTLKLSAFADEASGSLAGQISALRRNNIGYIELRGVDEKNVASLSVSEAREIKERLARDGIAVWAAGSPLGKSDINAPFERTREQLSRLLEISAALGTKRIRMFSFYIPSGEDAAVYRDEVMERLGRLVEYSRGSGIILCHENEKGIFGDTPERVLDIHRSVGGLRGVFDPANYIQCGVLDTLAAYKTLAPYIEYLHIKDALRGGSVVPAGHGVGRNAEIIGEFSALNPTGVLSVEPHLHVFSGSEALERKPLAERFEYPTSGAAFDAAVTALRKIIK